MEDDTIADIIMRKTSFMEQRRRSLGPEYYSNKDFWDRMWEQEWVNLEEIKEIEIDESAETIPINHPTVEIEIENELKVLTIYSYSDFTMLHNQGIFREELFIIDHTGKWKKNVIKELGEYGFSQVSLYKRNMLIMEVKK
jgi:hypothetical protein